MNGSGKGGYHRPPFRAPLKQARGGVHRHVAPRLIAPMEQAVRRGRLPCYFFHALKGRERHARIRGEAPLPIARFVVGLTIIITPSHGG